MFKMPRAMSKLTKTMSQLPKLTVMFVTIDITSYNIHIYENNMVALALI